MKIYFCTTATSSEYKSWSNIPYLLHRNLEERGLEVDNYVLREVEPFKTLFNLPIRVLNKFFKLGTTYFYVRTPVHFFLARICSIWIRLVSRPNDLMLVQGFSYPSHNGKNRQVILGDWPSEYLFEKFLERKPSHLERKSIDRENDVIEAADAVITLFPNVREYMLKKYKNRNIYCFGNVVNIDDNVTVPSDVRERKLKSNRLLFIGQSFYLPGALELIDAVRNLRTKGINCELDIIGISPKLIGINHEWLKVHGYLDKDNPLDKQKYYEILSNARLFVNTTPGWSGFQAILEAMYFGNPIVVRPNEAIRSYFQNLDEVAFLLKDEQVSLETLLQACFNDDIRYLRMSDAAKLSVESSTWKNFTDRLLDLIKYEHNHDGV
jgi:glycosyltransferase involved in cell wall biosynthesis